MRIRKREKRSHLSVDGVNSCLFTISLAKKEMISIEEDLILQFLSCANSVSAGTIC